MRPRASPLFAAAMAGTTAAAGFVAVDGTSVAGFVVVAVTMVSAIAITDRGIITHRAIAAGSS